MTDTSNGSQHDAASSRSPSVNSQSYAIPMPAEIEEQLTEDSSSLNDSLSAQSNEEGFLERAIPESGRAFSHDSQEVGPMLDVSKYIFESLVQSIDSADFSEAISLQTKTSAIINSKSMELKQIIDDTKVRFHQLKERFERGAITSRKVRHNLQYSKEKIDKLNALLRTDYPIEFNQAREKVLERQLDDE
ncbi:KXD1 (YGL079W) [Zygosaccharomyces parabailii]|uniref:Biogenesis of lysosome-related organelles complex 1 subunit KXD1 n=1 Tax=Zygosaccharomyces bailii (strain CLIB 213 / ATCC 58445 / CBS 680 / BCRC 21525 / NBRC 1098 / NCYC 1416 / NRRL Y-2227) TaxID=1333698 RepID=A0A8J2T4A2_ZYGB2|nr:KXD1 (YGL079W) [Zygosaccharomyces parabailii]CDF87886.1 BN860_16710g1_1 [Zygosaccharomyces bailii CLIB 213]CDH12137.1 probable Biogenesis of lysosome-related organelles complex 1 subunit KXD1 [Zygosaccharomyces bailii ISA1307]SJM83716.1 probable Biogenesis of lysosome-related organelles complex 1 subunit KXD1 [Zygosaccharomyces bailii]